MGERGKINTIIVIKRLDRGASIPYTTYMGKLLKFPEPLTDLEKAMLELGLPKNHRPERVYKKPCKCSVCCQTNNV